jgi:hypothetical protein
MNARSLRHVPADVLTIMDGAASRRHEVRVADFFMAYRKMPPRVREARDEAVGLVCLLKAADETAWRYRTAEVARFFGITRVAVDQCRQRAGNFVSRK